MLESELIRALNTLRIPHQPNCAIYNEHSLIKDCSCGAKEHNAKIDALIRQIQEIPLS